MANQNELTSIYIISSLLHSTYQQVMLSSVTRSLRTYSKSTSLNIHYYHLGKSRAVNMLGHHRSALTGLPLSTFVAVVTLNQLVCINISQTILLPSFSYHI